MRHTPLTGLSNPVIREALAMKEKRAKYRSESFLIEGPHVIEMALQPAVSLKRLFFSEEFARRRDGAGLLRKLSKRGIETHRVTGQILSRLSDTETPQGIVALATYRCKTFDELPLGDNPVFVVIDEVQDPGNLGTIIRTSDAAGADAVIILPNTCDAFMPKAIRATAGSIFNIPIVYSEIDGLIKGLRKKSIKILVTDTRARESIYDADLSVPLAFVFGNEAHGAGERIKKEADVLLRIPIPGRAESLNVATSAAICLYEGLRQRRALS
jgi:TrmH family RNA methyltransferase